MATVAINFGGLWVYDARVSNGPRLPLSALLGRGCHVHGRLDIVIGGRRLPYVGYWGADDVCLGEWASELRKAVTVLQSTQTGRHVYDEGEQGQPAFVFQRAGDELLVSIADSEVSDGEGDPQWQGVRCRFHDFKDAVTLFTSELRRQLRAQAPATDQWWEWAIHD